MLLLTSGGVETRDAISSHPLCIGQPPTTSSCLTPNVNSVKVGQLSELPGSELSGLFCASVILLMLF